MRICLVYDCLYPHTVGGAERWYRELALRLAAEGHTVSYLTLRQWAADESPDLPGVRVRVAGPRMALYNAEGQRRVLPPLVFGAGVLWHLLRHGRRYDVVHTSSFPYFSLLAAALVRPLHRFGLVVDWVEHWSREYWRDYLGGLGGAVGWAVQKRCVRVRQRAFCYAELTAGRLRADGLRGPVTVLRGLRGGALSAAVPVPAAPVVVFAGRHIPEKRAPAVVAAIAAARRRLPQLRGVIFGQGPETDAVRAAIVEHCLQDVVSAPGFVERETYERTLASALCLVHPSSREGYGIVVVDSASVGVPTVLVAGPDNAATELVEPGVNGLVAASASPEDLGDAIVAMHEAGGALRASTAAWFDAHAPELSIDASLDVVAASYEAASARS